MLEKKSKYECPICKLTLESAVGINISCLRCNVQMREIKKGIIMKGRIGGKERKT